MGKDNIEIRIAMGKDKQKVVDLWRYSFQETEAFVEYYFSKRFLPENTMLLENNEKLEAALHMNPYNLVIGDVICEASYIVGVSVQPESRGLGYMNQLLTKTLNYQYQNGEEFSILMPIDTRIYTKYGYANCFMKHEFTVELSRIVYQKPVYKIRRIDINSAENLERDIHSLNEIYYNVAARHHSFVSRNSRYWKNRFGELEIENAQLFVVYDQLTPKGYMILLPQSTDGTALVVEMAFLDATAFQDLMGLLKGHSTQFQQAVISTPQYVEFDMMTQFDNKIKHSVKPFMMGRVIDGEKILDNILYKPQIFGDKLGFSPEENVEYSIGLTDDFIPENNFVMYCLNGKIQSVNRQKTKEPLALHLELNVSELAQIYTKAYTVRQLLELRNAPNQEEQIQFFERIFGKEIQQNYINDYI